MVDAIEKDFSLSLSQKKRPLPALHVSPTTTFVNLQAQLMLSFTSSKPPSIFHRIFTISQDHSASFIMDSAGHWESLSNPYCLVIGDS